MTSDVDARTPAVFEAMGHGAIDAVYTPSMGTGNPLAGATPFLNKIDAIAQLIGNAATLTLKLSQQVTQG